MSKRFLKRQEKFTDYAGFVEKFETKKTTDDCYTPANVYEVVANYVAETYGVDRVDMVRPFWPGGDYEQFEYPAGCCVVDNPPFSIISRICKDYIAARIRFFLFCPYLTAASLVKATDKGITLIVAPVDIEYENGAKVKAGFVTNLEPGTVLRTDPELLDRLAAANLENLEKKPYELPKYEYPPEILTVAMAGRYAQRHVVYKLAADDCVMISKLDAQTAHGKSIFGSGFLLSERAAAERVITWSLSPKEKQIQKAIGKTRYADNEQREG